MRLFVTGAWSPTLPFRRKRVAAEIFKLWTEPPTDMVVVTAAPGLDSFAAAYFSHRKVPTIVCPIFSSIARRDYQVMVELDVEYAFVAGWDYAWRRRLTLLEVPHSVLWEDEFPLPEDTEDTYAETNREDIGETDETQ